MTNMVESKPAKQVKSCETCKHHSVNFSEDDDGNKVERLATIHNTELFWTYEACAKKLGTSQSCVCGWFQVSNLGCKDQVIDMDTPFLELNGV